MKKHFLAADMAATFSQPSSAACQEPAPGDNKLAPGLVATFRDDVGGSSTE